MYRSPDYQGHRKSQPHPVQSLFIPECIFLASDTANSTLKGNFALMPHLFLCIKLYLEAPSNSYVLLINKI